MVFDLCLFPAFALPGSLPLATSVGKPSFFSPPFFFHLHRLRSCSEWSCCRDCMYSRSVPAAWVSPEQVRPFNQQECACDFLLPVFPHIYGLMSETAITYIFHPTLKLADVYHPMSLVRERSSYHRTAEYISTFPARQKVS